MVECCNGYEDVALRRPIGITAVIINIAGFGAVCIPTVEIRSVTYFKGNDLHFRTIWKNARDPRQWSLASTQKYFNYQRFVSAQINSSPSARSSPMKLKELWPEWTLRFSPRTYRLNELSFPVELGLFGLIICASDDVQFVRHLELQIFIWGVP